MTKKELEEVRRRCGVATPGPWTISYSEEKDVGKHQTGIEGIHSPAGDYLHWDILETDSGYYGPKKNDAEFIAHARADIPKLLDYIDKLKDVLQFYADEKNWQWTSPEFLRDEQPVAMTDAGQKAREALG